MTSNGTDSESDIASSTFGALSNSTGWTYSPGTVSGDPASKNLTWSTTAATASLAVTTTNHAQGSSNPGTLITFTRDPDAPTAGFNHPAGGALVMQATTGYTVDWGESDSTGSGLSTRSVQRQHAAATSGTCPSPASASWTNDGSSSSPSTPSLTVTGLPTAFCYRWVVTLTDRVGNSGPSTSGSVLVDAGQAPIPNVSLTPGSGVWQPGTNGTVFFKPATGGSIGLTATTPVTPPSGVACIQFGNLTPSTGWTATPSLPNCDTTSPYSETLGFGSSTGTASIDAQVKNGVGTLSNPPRTIALSRDTGTQSADFITPDEADHPLLNSTSYSVNWTESAGAGSGIASHSLQRQIRDATGGGMCGGTWANDEGVLTSFSLPLAVTLGDGHCYQWIVTITDHVGNAKSFTSGEVLVDTTHPSAAISDPVAGQPLVGTVTVAGTATDLNFASYVLAYGVGSTPTTWNPIATSTTPVASAALGTWETGSLAIGTYTLRLTVTDKAGNQTAVSSIVYVVDDTERGDEAYHTSIPFDMGGGWGLGVNVATGEASLSRDLFSIPSYGPGQALSLEYNSGQTSTAGQFGRGWSSNLTQYLDLSGLASGLVVWHRADGGEVPFGSVDGTTWTPLAGHYETLTRPTGGYKIRRPTRAA